MRPSNGSKARSNGICPAIGRGSNHNGRDETGQTARIAGGAQVLAGRIHFSDEIMAVVDATEPAAEGMSEPNCKTHDSAHCRLRLMRGSSMAAEKLEQWASNIEIEPKRSLDHRHSDGFFHKYLRGKNILHVGPGRSKTETYPVSPGAIAVDFDYPGYDGKTLPFSNGSQDAVLCCYYLQGLDDYRSAIADWFRVLKMGGFLIIIVPHQYLFERKLTLPSSFVREHKRFDTPASLLLEIQESLTPSLLSSALYGR